VYEGAVRTVTFWGQYRLGCQFAAGVASAAQPAEPLLADGEDDRKRHWSRLGEDASGDGYGGRDRDRVVTDPRAVQPAVALRNAPHRALAEDVVDVNEHGEAVRWRAERPHQVAGAIDVPAPGRLRQAALQPVDTHSLVAGTAVQFGQCHGISGDRLRVESRVLHVTWPNATRHHPADGSVPFH